MRNPNARNHRICFRTTRALYWRLRDDALDRGMTPSEWIYWVLAAAVESYSGSTLEATNASVAGSLPEWLLAEFTRSVEKGAARVDRSEVPW
jgi:hypothetical protein